MPSARLTQARAAPALSRETAAIRVFVSYSRADFAFVQALYGVLATSVTVRPWLDVVELRGGGDWRAQIADGIDTSAFFVLVLSRDSLRSAQVRSEWERADRNGLPIVLVRIDSARLRPEHAEYPVYDLRRGFRERGGVLRRDLEADRLRGLSTRLPWLPPAAVLFVLAGSVAIIGWLLYLWSVAPRTPVGASFPVRSRWLGDFSFSLTHAGVACIAAAAGLTVILQVGSLRSVLRRRVDPMGLVCVLMSAALVVAVSDLFVSALPRAPLWPHLLLQDAFLAVAIVSSRTVWRHPDLQVRTALGRMRRPEVDDGEVNDLSGAHTDREADWLNRLLPGWPPGGGSEGMGTVAVRCVPGEDDLARSIEALCVRLGFKMADTAPDHLIVLVGPRTDLAACVEDAARSGAHPVFVLVESLAISADAEEIRRHQWVDLRRQEVGSFRNLARSLHAGVPGTDAVHPPVDPSRFSAPLVVTWMVNILIGQTVLGLQLVIIRLAVPQDPVSWRVLSISAASVYCVAGFLMAIALVRHWSTPRVFRWSVLPVFLSAVVVDVTLLRDSTSVLMIGFVVALLLLQFLAHSGCLVVSHSNWTARPAPGAGFASLARTFWPSVAVGVLLLLLVTPAFLGLAPPLER